MRKAHREWAFFIASAMVEVERLANPALDALAKGRLRVLRKARNHSYGPKAGRLFGELRRR
jgi:hypothetical protein